MLGQQVWRYRFALLVVALLCIARPVGALGPTGRDTLQRAPTRLGGPLALSAGEEGPFFSLADLERSNRHERIARLPPTHAPSLAEEAGKNAFTWQDLAAYVPPVKVPPPVTSPLLVHWQYPETLKGVPRAQRSFSVETAAYLAQHEIHSGDPSSPYIGLTFDCELYPQHILSILRTLREEKVHATFFVLGKFAYNFPGVIQQMAADGHEIANHSFFHPFFTEISAIEATREITYTEAAINRAVGYVLPMRYFRFPGGYRDQGAKETIAALGYQSVTWTVDAREWEAGKTEEAAMAIIDRQLRRGGIVLLHCREIDTRLVPAVIQTIRARGLIPGRVSDAIRAEDRVVPGYPEPSAP